MLKNSNNYIFTINNSLIVLSAILLPFDVFAIQLYASSYDLTAFIILILAFYNYLLYASFKNFTYILFFLLLELIIFMINSTPAYRFLSALTWLGGILLLSQVSHKIQVDFHKISKFLSFSISLSALYCIYELYLFGSEVRPKAWFGEPSPAGLVFFATSLGLFSSGYLTHSLFRFTYFIPAILFFLFGIATKSMHLITYFISFFCLVIIISNKINKIYLSILLILISAFITYILFNNEHYFERLNFKEPGSNLSILSWLRGMDQMLYSIKESYLFGSGLGSTGFFDFNSIYSDKLASLGFDDLNLRDAYSMFFRLVIELGVLPVIIILVLIYKKLYQFKYYINSSIKLDASMIFLFIFSFTLIIGVLIKEGVYSRSFFYFGCLIFMLPFTSNRN